MANIIIKGKSSLGKTRSEQEMNLRKEWGSTMNDGQLDKLRYSERKFKDRVGMKPKFARLTDVDKVK